ncbi:MAG: C-GCAxxG-C-C family protein [Bacteroidales bacterium]|nr:C-GCAxxG-C-C family protein [Bacteroidales bacterium]
MNQHEEKAVQSFRSGLNCAQAVITAYADRLHFDYKQALCLSCGFGGGMGRLQETCGAVTGAFMILGFHNCKKYSNNKDRKNGTYAMVQKFAASFKEKNGKTDCRSLLGCDLTTEEGQKYLKEHNLHETICEKCILDAIAITDELIKEQEK